MLLFRRSVQATSLLAALLAALVVAGCASSDDATGDDGPSLSPDDDDENNDNDSDDDDDDDDDNDDNDNDDDDDDDNDDNDNDNNDSSPVLIAVEGEAYSFDPSFSMVSGASIAALERPDLDPVLTDDNGSFRLEGLHAGDELSLVLTHDEYFPTQTATVVPGPDGLFDLTVMAPPRYIVWLLALVLLEPLSPDACQIAATVSPAGGNPFSPGIAGATVTIDPPLDPECGPFYFYYYQIPGGPAIDIPVRWLTETTDDGGVVFINAPPGRYTLTAHKDDMEFAPATIECRAGVLVNAAPPYGLQAVE
jgi:hypothetical protein